MKIIIIFLISIVFSVAYASNNSQCLLENYFLETEQYKSSLLDDKEKKLELERKELSLLPDIYVGVGQYTSNNRSFQSIKESSVDLGISQKIYDGGNFIKSREKINSDIEYNKLMLHDKRNNYLIDLYRSVIEYKYKLDLRELYFTQLQNQNIQFEAAQENFKSGNIAEIELTAAKIRKDDLFNKLKYLDSEIQQSELDIYANFNVPLNYISSINKDTILSCKTESVDYVLKKSRVLLHQIEKANLELEKTTMLPHASLSAYISPPESGTLKDLSLRKSDFGVSINVTIPVSNFFSMNSIENSYAIAVNRINHTHDQKSKIYFREKERTKIKLNQLKNDLILSKRIVELRNREVNYIFNRFKDKKENIISYYRQMDEYDLAKINMKREEREIEFNEVYLSILD
ncbi:TolC family protein [Escherichia coli]